MPSTQPDPQAVIAALQQAAPPIVRWSGAIAKQLRRFDIAVDGKSSGNANTDALTLADLSVQELIVAALRDADPVLRQCRLEGEEETGEIDKFSSEADLAITIDPIDGTKQFRDRTGDGYSVILQLQTADDVLYSLVFAPEQGPAGTWVEAAGDRIVCGPDDTNVPARKVLDAMQPWTHENRSQGSGVYLIGFQQRDSACAAAVTECGACLQGFTSDQMPGSVYPFNATGEFAGSLIHSPNIYDFPVSLHLARILGGDAVWVHNREPVHFQDLWMDDRANMLRLPGIVACSERPEVLDALCTLAQDWNPVRYAE